MYRNALENREKVIAVAPMMDWTDRHCRFLHRQLSRKALLYTEMVIADAILFGDRERLIGFDLREHPVALQIGGNDPEKLARAALIAQEFGYDEINLNVGCPSDRVQAGTFGACLMREPKLVGECVGAMKERVRVPVTVKCRLGVDDQDTGPALDTLAQSVWEAGADAIWVHARKAWLSGLSPKENRDIPPLDYHRVRRLKKENPNRFIGLNGGLESPIHAFKEISIRPQLDGAMLGRAAYHNPAILLQVDSFLGTDRGQQFDWPGLIDAMMEYAERHIASGGRLAHVTRHMTGLFHGLPGARRWRQILSTEVVPAGAGSGVIRRAFSEVRFDSVVKAA